MITAFYAGILGLIFIGLTMMIVRLRWRYRVSLGDAGHEDLQRRIRAHGNFAEMVPLSVVLMGFAEMQNMPLVVLHGAGIALVIGRLCHAYAIYTATLPLRTVGMIATIATIAIMSIWNIYFVMGAFMH